MVKWLKIDKQDKTRRRRQEIGQVAIYYISKQAIIIGDERKCKSLSHYILLQSWQDRNKKPYQNMLRKLQSTKGLTLMQAQLIANSYGVHISAVSEQSIPKELRVNL
jgi:hypothetical protein